MHIWLTNFSMVQFIGGIKMEHCGQTASDKNAQIYWVGQTSGYFRISTILFCRVFAVWESIYFDTYDKNALPSFR